MMELVKKSLLLTMIAATSAWAEDGVKIGNGDGGDAVYCRHSSDDNVPVDGYYFLDYLATLNMDFGENVQITGWSQSAARIQHIFQSLSPGMAESFKSYVQDLANHHDFTRAHVWEPADGILAIHDQKLVSSVPESCMNHGSIKLFQVVAHQNPQVSGRPAGQRVYTYVPKMFDALNKTSPLQMSYLYLHEWLWKHSDNVNRNRRINRMIHSVSLQEMSAAEIKQQLIGMGFDFTQFDGSNPTPNKPAPNPNTPAKPRPLPPGAIDYRPTESNDEIKNLFTTEDYCKERINHPYNTRYYIGGEAKFRFYGWLENVLNHRGGGSSSIAFDHDDMTKHRPASNHVLNARIVKTVGNSFDLQIDGGEVIFHCNGTMIEGSPPQNPSSVGCYAVAKSDGERLYWLNTKRPVQFIGNLYPGCFVAKTEPVDVMTGAIFGKFMIIGEF